MSSVAWDSYVPVTPGTKKSRTDEITAYGLVPFEATPLETVPLKTRTARNEDGL